MFSTIRTTLAVVGVAANNLRESCWRGRQQLPSHVFALFLLFFGKITAQTDTFPMPVGRLAEPDILLLKEVEKPLAARCATRTEQPAEEVLNTVFVVTGAEILRNGWVTLGDVLRNCPGIRVSQPGNAMEGETFLMEGAHGNSEVEILLNDVPIRPSAAPGMPIGAQLPIRQAERIEVLYGPGGGLYGRETPGGIVNIVLKETERPLFTKADLSFGRNGYNSLDLFFGGKLGRDKNIFRFSIYGSSTSVDDLGIYRKADKSQLFDASRYLLPGQDSSFYLGSRQFEGVFNKDSVETSLALTAPTPHESRHFGLNLRWHGLQMSYNRLYRRDHSALGFSPLAQSTANSQTYIGETIEAISVGARARRGSRSFFYNLSAVFHRLDDRSTEVWIAPVLTAAYFRQIDPGGQMNAQQKMNAQRQFDRRYFDLTRYLAAMSTDLRQEIRWERRLWKAARFELGQVTQLSAVRPVARFSEEPAQGLGVLRFRSAFKSPSLDTTPNFENNLVAWAQLHISRKRWQVLASYNWLLRFGFNEDEVAVDESFAPSGRVFASVSPFRWWQVRGGVVRSVRRVPSWTNAATLQLRTKGPMTSLDGATGVFSPLADEGVRSFEVGSRFKKGEFFNADVSFFHRKRTNWAACGYIQQLPLDTLETARSSYGWFSDSLSTRTVMGLQAAIRSRLATFDVEIGKKTVFFHWENNLYFTHSRGRTRMPRAARTIDGVAGMPTNILRFQTGLLFAKTTFFIHFNRESNAPTGEHFWKERWPRPFSRDTDRGRRTVDVILRRSMGKNFQIYLTATNLFNRGYSGLDATGTPDDLFLNPQPGRQTRLGINYNMN